MILCDEMARLVAEVKKTHNMMSAMQNAMEEKDRIIAELRLENETQKKSSDIMTILTARRRKTRAT